MRGDFVQLVRGALGNGTNGMVKYVPEVGKRIKPGDSLLELTYAKDALVAYKLGWEAAEWTAKNRRAVTAFQDVRAGIARRSTAGVSAEEKTKAAIGKEAASYDTVAANLLAKKAEMDSTPYEETSLSNKTIIVVEVNVEVGEAYQSYIDAKTTKPFVVASELDMFKIAAWIPRVNANKLKSPSVMRRSLEETTITISAVDKTFKPKKIVVETGRVSYRNDRLVRVWLHFDNTPDQEVWFGNVADVNLVIQ